MSLRSRPGVSGAFGRMVALLAVLALTAVACGGSDDDTAVGASSEPLTISAIPDQDPEKLGRLYGAVADYLSAELGVTVNYQPVTDYAASVSLFRTGDLDLVWFGGLTGVQARLQVDGAQAVVQRDIDEQFHSVFIVNNSTGIKAFEAGTGLSALKGKRFTFGSESSTSGRLMPQYFLEQAGVSTNAFSGPAGFSGSHDKTIELVASGSYEAGVLNEQVWKDRVASGAVDPTKVTAVYRTPAYHDYHWVLRPDVAARYGNDFTQRLVEAFTSLDPANPEHRVVLDLFGAQKFIPTANGEYAQIEEVGRQIGLITG